MLKSYELFNFDHGIKKPKKLAFGKYEVRISQKQCSNLDKLERNASHTFTTEDNLSKRVVKLNKSFTGQNVVTATLYLDEEDITSSAMYAELPERNSVDDFVLLLSFITGRRVLLERDFGLNDSRKYLDSVVGKNFFFAPSINIEKGQNKLKELKLTTQLLNLVQLKTMRDLPAMCFYANSIVNAVYERWCKQHSFSKYNNKNIEPNKIKDFIRLKCDASFLAIIRKWICNFLTEQSTNNEIKDDILARVNISTQPSAIYKFQNFLTGIKLFPEEPSDEAIKRLKYINTVRNLMIHMGDIPKDKKISFQQRAEITSSITFVLIAICNYYFAKYVFFIDDYLVEKNASDIRDYFENGLFRGKDVFNETYDEFINKQNIEWVENGK